MKPGNFIEDFSLKSNETIIYKDAIFFDLEHYVYKRPVCIGVFGCCYYDEKDDLIKSTQYMIENRKDSLEILKLARNYFKDIYKNKGKKHIVTFSGNNDFTVINYLFHKYGINFDIKEHFIHVDLQREYEKAKGVNIGLKVLEKEFDIERESELISGQNLAKTFGKIIKDEDYINRMPDEKKEKILLYNEQDVVSLFYMCLNWEEIISKCE
ncbi:ribonuclease H-like domain-containing protein [Clostridium lundense]|uniref:ribonuclease H-like domain-containing protein n=1 Tax=Clostridium lundense TaxID=319475 RepID=UPI0004873DB6|nr:ribonuclease H-like domain-containing protein [Clostridium lundense]